MFEPMTPEEARAQIGRWFPDQAIDGQTVWVSRQFWLDFQWEMLHSSPGPVRFEPGPCSLLAPGDEIARLHGYSIRIDRRRARLRVRV